MLVLMVMTAAAFVIMVMMMAAAAAGALLIMVVMMVVTTAAFIIVMMVMAAMMLKLQRNEGRIDMRDFQTGRLDDVFQLRVGSDGKAVVARRRNTNAAGQQGVHRFTHHVDVAADFGNIFLCGVNNVEVALFVYQHVAHFQRLFQLERIGERIAGGGLEFLGRLFAF